MMETPFSDVSPVVVEADHLQLLLDALRAAQYQVVGPVRRDGAVVYEELTSVADLPIGWTDVQEAGSYRLKRRNDRAFFGFAPGPHSWKQFLHPPSLRLWQADREGGRFEVQPEENAAPRRALLGIRACELRAIGLLDRVFLSGRFRDPAYAARREGLFLVAVGCSQPGGTCFCASLGSGPYPASGYDLALTEVLEDRRHFFVVEIGSERGADMLQSVPHREADERQSAKPQAIAVKAAARMGRSLDTTGLKEFLYRNYDNPHWEEIATRCLTCGNCTMVCPTCFCTTVDEVSDLAGRHAERRRIWDSCFTMDYSYIHGGSVRYSPMSRYRQWLTHKFAAWEDQFGENGCVGCGRCVTWCPAAIDITEEIRALRKRAPSTKEGSNGDIGTHPRGASVL